MAASTSVVNVLAFCPRNSFLEPGYRNRYVDPEMDVPGHSGQRCFE